MIPDLPGVAVAAEAAVTALWLGGVALIRKRTPRWDLVLWAVAWVARGFGSLYGARYVAQAGGEPATYALLQSAAAMMLLMAMVRAELRACRERLAAHVKERIQW